MNQAEDVEVVLSHDRRYKFHSGTLARNSTLFARMLTEANAAKLGGKAKHMGIQTRWMLELTHLPSEHFPGGQIALVDLNPNGEPFEGTGTGLIVNENGRIPQAEKAFTHYENILYAFYNMQLTIDDLDMTAALQDCYELLQIADYIGCAPLISKPIEVALLKHGQELFRAIQSAPHLWVDLAYRVRSEIMFRECMVHLAGNWKVIAASKTAKGVLRGIPGLARLIARYHSVLVARCKAFELALLSKFPGEINKPSQDIPIKREAYAKDVLVWLALVFLRQFLSQQLVSGEGREAKDCGYALYTKIARGGEAYLDKSVINQFHTKFPMTKKAMGVLENHLREIKECMWDVLGLHKILVSTCELDTKRFPVEYLTCTVFKKKDFPWVGEARGKPVTPVKRVYKPGGNDIARHNLDEVARRQEREREREREPSEDPFEEEGTDDEFDEDEDDDEFEEEITPSKRRRVN